MIVLQFGFSNADVIPMMVKRQNRESTKERLERKNRSSGVMVIEPTEMCSIEDFLGELEAKGYEMVDAFYKKRIDVKDPSGKKTYHMVRFTFARHEFTDLSEEFKKVRGSIRAELRSICRVALWRVRAFSNPFFMNGEEILGQQAVSINLEARKPLFLPDGRPVTVWQKDKNGRRVGNTPLPLKANHRLRILDNVVQLVTA